MSRTDDDDDDWKPRKHGAKGDFRPYLKTNVGTAPGLPQEDEYNRGVVYCGTGKRVWVGNEPNRRYKREIAPGHKTQVRKLFELLYPSPGRWHSLAEIHEQVFGRSLNGMSKAEMKQAEKHVRRLISKLKLRLGEGDADDDAIIVAKSDNHRPGYMLLLIADQKYQDGQEPWPGLGYDDPENRSFLKEERREAGLQPGVVYWGHKSIYLGEITRLRKLFHCLADQPGHWRSIFDIEEAVVGTCSDANCEVPEADVKKMQQKIRGLISRLQRGMRKAGIRNAVIVPHRRHIWRWQKHYYRLGYVLLLMPEEQFEIGEEPQPIAESK